MGPELAVADGALGFWKAVEEVWPQTSGQRCWAHKTANVLNKLPKSQQSKAKRALQEIWIAETKKDALAAFDALVETWGAKYEKAIECLRKDPDALLVFYDYSAEHWKHLRTTNVNRSRSGSLARGLVVVASGQRERGRLAWTSTPQKIVNQPPRWCDTSLSFRERLRGSGTPTGHSPFHRHGGLHDFLGKVGRGSGL
jgi:Transposase, Mutator family